MRNVVFGIACSVILARTSLAPAEPARAAPAVEHDEVELPNPLATVYFAVGSTRIAPDARASLAATLDWLREHPNRLLLIEGHADRNGSAVANLRLSQRRADAVRDALVRLGADPLRLVQSGHGEVQATGDAADNRRVVLRGTVHGYRELISSQRPRPRESLRTPDARPTRDSQ